MRSLRRVDQVHSEPVEIKPFTINQYRVRILCPRRPNGESVMCALNSIPQRGKMKPGVTKIMQEGASQRRRQGSGEARGVRGRGDEEKMWIWTF